MRARGKAAEGPAAWIRVLPVVVAAALAAAGCAAGGPGYGLPRTGGPGRELRLALREWSGFPVSAARRPVVLVGPAVLGPGGALSAAAKTAFLRADIRAPRAFPPGPGAADGYPLIGARRAFRAFGAGPAPVPAARADLAVTGVRLGAAAFWTDRGKERLPAWLFAFRGVGGTAAVLAVAPPATWSPVRRSVPGSATGWSARLGPDGRTLTVRFFGAPSGTGPCTATYHLLAASSPAAVAVAVRTRMHYGGGVTCAAVGVPVRVTTVLPAPLGARVLVDAADGAPIPVLVMARRPLA